VAVDGSSPHAGEVDELIARACAVLALENCMKPGAIPGSDGERTAQDERPVEDFSAAAWARAHVSVC
jgi:hypothetical protein